MPPLFTRYIGIDYSGARTPSSSLKGLRVYVAATDWPATEIQPPPSPRWYWTRREIAEWLADRLKEEQPTLVGIDHGFSFPLRYFETHLLPPHWPMFLEDFRFHWPTDRDHTYIDFIRDGAMGNGAARTGNSRWRRITEVRAKAKSVFHFDCQGSVAKSTHAGIPWLLYLRNALGDKIHFWPFDGWNPPPGKSVIVEAYPALWNRAFPREDRTPDQHDAYAIAEWMRRADANGSLAAFFAPHLDPGESRVAQDVEGWIFGVM
jgi:hypothetical protein